MAMGTCRECSSPVSTEAVTCPSCGVGRPTADLEAEARAQAAMDAKVADSNHRFTVVFLTLAALFAGLMVAAAFVGGDDDGSERPAGDSAEVQTAGAELACEDFLKGRLRSPASAEFHDTRSTRSGMTWTVTGSVDAENAFGAALRRRWTCDVRLDGDTWRGSANLVG